MAALRGTYGIDASLTDAEAVAAIEVIINTPEPEPAATAEERIAAALEFQSTLALPDETEV